MPYLDVNGCRYFYEEAGAGPETILFGHGFLMTHRMWERQIAFFRDHYRCIALDWRGQGWSEVTRRGYSVLELTEDVLALADRLDVGPCHYVGLSMGGFVGFRLLLRRPDWLRSAALLHTQADAEDGSHRLRYEAMLLIARTLGYAPVLDRAVQMLFGPAFLNDPANEREIARWRGIIQSNDRVGVYRAGQGIFRRPNVRPQLGAVRTPALLVAGADDVSIPVTRVRAAADAIPSADFTILPAVGHSSAIERPDAVNDTLARFIAAHSAVSLA